jgi:hypothetical protein
VSAFGVQVATTALIHFIGADASRRHATAALDVWLLRNGWLLDDSDIPAVLAAFDATDWPSSIHHHEVTP